LLVYSHRLVFLLQLGPLVAGLEAVVTAPFVAVAVRVLIAPVGPDLEFEVVVVEPAVAKFDPV
jgi:hypothetical protein